MKSSFYDVKRTIAWIAANAMLRKKTEKEQIIFIKRTSYSEDIKQEAINIIKEHKDENKNKS